MNAKDNKYLVLRGKNKDIYFIQKRLSKNLAAIIGKEFIKKSLETKNIDIARKKRDEILKELDLIEKNTPILENINTNAGGKLQNEGFDAPSENNSEFNDIYDNEDANNSYFRKLIDFSFSKKNIIMKIDKFIPIGILVLTILIAFVA
jgi:hypothetical protein